MGILKVACLLFLFITPLSAIAFLLGATPRSTVAERIAIANKACIYSFLFLLPFCFTGPLLFNLLHVHVAAFRIAGGIILIVAGINMMLPRSGGSGSNDKNPADITFVPLTFPLMAGPGTITLVLGQSAERTLWGRTELCLAIALALVGIWICFYVCLKGSRWLTPTMVKLAERLTGVFIGTLAIQCILNGLSEEGFSLFPFTAF